MNTYILTCKELNSMARLENIDKIKSKHIFPNISVINGYSKFNLNDKFNIFNNNIYNDGWGDKRWNKPNLAVSYGHYKIWLEIQINNNIGIVLEDDINPIDNINYEHYIKELVNEAQKYDNDKYLITLWKNGIRHFENTENPFLNVIPSYGNSGALFYILTPKVATILIENFKNIECPVDHYILGMGKFNEPYSILCSKENMINTGILESIRY